MSRSLITQARTLATARTAVATSALLTGLVEYWTLDEASGNRVGKVAGIAMAPQGSPLPGNVTGKLRSALNNVRANSNFLNAGQQASMSPGAGDFTIQSWFYVASDPGASDYGIFSRFSSGVQEWAAYVQKGANIGLVFKVAAPPSGASTTTVSISVPTLALNVWHHALCWRDSVANTINILLDGTRTASVAQSAGVAVSSNTQTRIASYNSSSAFDGLVDGCAYWSRLLTPTEKLLVWNNGNGLDYPFNRPLPGATRTAA